MQHRSFIQTFPGRGLVKAAIALFLLGFFPSCRVLTLPNARPVIRVTPSMRAVPTLVEPTTSPARPTTIVTDTTTPSPTVTYTPTAIVPGTVLFEEDFEDGLFQSLTDVHGNWNVMTEDTGNKVLDGDNRSNSREDLSFNFGALMWTDYAFDYDVKFRNIGELLVMVRSNPQGYYILRWTLIYGHIGLNVSIPRDAWNQLKSRTYETSTGIWYHMRVEVQGQNLRVFVQDKLEIEVTDSQIQSGNVGFGVFVPTRVQLDNLRVTVLAPAIP